MSQHNTLGETGGAGGVLHITNVIGANGSSHIIDNTFTDKGIASHCLIEGKTAILTETNRNDIAQERKTLAVQALPCCDICQFRTQFIDNILIIGIQAGIDHHQCMGIGLS